MNKEIHPTDTVGYNYLSLPMVAASKGIQTILHICKQDVERITPLNSKHGIFSLIVTFAITVLDTIAALQMGWFKWHNYWVSREPPAIALSYMRGWISNIFKDIFYFLQYHCASDNDNHVLFNTWGHFQGTYINVPTSSNVWIPCFDWERHWWDETSIELSFGRRNILQ